MDIQMNQEQKKKMLQVFCTILSAPVLIVGVWSALITQLVSGGSFLGFVLIVAGSAVVYLTTFVMAKIAADNVQKFFTHASDIADGTIQLETSEKLAFQQENGKVNEIMQSVNNIARSYARVVSSIKKATSELGDVTGHFNRLFHELSEAGDGVGENINSISENIISQAEKMQAINHGIDEISSEIEQISANVEALAGSASNMQECNRSVETYITELINLNNENSKSIEKVRDQTELTNQSAMNIRTATEFIASISSQTNLLALNASIEAARAGEAGKGFAVVAEEIRQLADQSRESTEQINESVNELIKNAQFSVEVTQKVMMAFAEQTEKIHSTSDLFDSLRSEVNQVAGAIHSIESEVGSLNNNKDTIHEEVQSLADFSSQNEESAKVTLENTYTFEQVISDCKGVTDQVTSVSNELVKNLSKVARKFENH